MVLQQKRFIMSTLLFSMKINPSRFFNIKVCFEKMKKKMNDFVSDVSVVLLVGRSVDGQVSRNWCGSKVPTRRSCILSPPFSLKFGPFFSFLGKVFSRFSPSQYGVTKRRHFHI
jgi:hypothetical protein